MPVLLGQELLGWKPWRQNEWSSELERLEWQPSYLFPLPACQPSLWIGWAMAQPLQTPTPKPHASGGPPTMRLL